MRTVDVTRNTSETQIQIALNLDGTGKAQLNSGVPFLDHMLDQIARHGMIDLTVTAKGGAYVMMYVHLKVVEIWMALIR